MVNTFFVFRRNVSQTGRRSSDPKRLPNRNKSVVNGRTCSIIDGGMDKKDIPNEVVQVRRLRVFVLGFFNCIVGQYD